MNLSAEAKQILDRVVDQVANLELEKKGITDDIKTKVKDGEDRLREFAVTAAVIKQLAKEKNMDECERRGQRQFEETMDQCRAALGLLADTPLGHHAQERQIKKTMKRMREAA